MARMSLHDDQWKRIRPLLPEKQTDCGVTAKDNRTFLRNLVIGTGCMRVMTAGQKKGIGLPFLRCSQRIKIWNT